MRVLLLHNFYGSEAPSGENEVVALERKLLEERGHVVETIFRHSDEVRGKGLAGKIAGGVVTPWSVASFHRVRRVVSRFKPDVVHAHNTFPLLSPSVFRAARGVARVLTLHNYRLFCAAAIPMRGGSVCTECIDRRTALPALRYGCYRNSRLATLPLALSVELHRALGTWNREVEAIVTLTDFQRQRMIDAGVVPEQLHVKPNFFPGRPQVVKWEAREHVAVYVGRLSDEKGVRTLVRAWADWGEEAPVLRIIGDGPLRGVLEDQARSSNARISFLGKVAPDEAVGWIGRSKLLILPSECFEGFPMVLREALAMGTPSLVSALGPLPGILGESSGMLFEAGNASSLLHAARGLFDPRGAGHAMSLAARSRFEACFTEDANYSMLMQIYAAAIARTHPKRARREAGVVE